MNTSKDIYYCSRCNTDAKFIYVLNKWVCQKCKAYAYRKVKERKDERNYRERG